MTVAFAAALVEMTAKYDDSILAQARGCAPTRCGHRMLEIADIERDVYEPVIEAEAMRRTSRSVRTGSRRPSPRPTSPALTIAGAGAQVASLAAESATKGNPVLIGDAVTAAELADGATRAAAHLVRMNLSTRRAIRAGPR